jgi:hypothetical protein
MPKSQPPRPIPRILAFGLSLALFLALLPSPSVTVALAQGSPAHHSTASGHTGKRHHRAKHPSHKHKRTAKAHAPALTAALCEDATKPIAGSGSFSCADGSEPSCLSGATPTLSASGTALLCPTGEATPSEAEPGCEAEGSCASGTDGSLDEETACAPCEHPSVNESES